MCLRNTKWLFDSTHAETRTKLGQTRDFTSRLQACLNLLFMKSDFFPSLGKTRGQSLSLKTYAATYGNPKSLLLLKNSFEFEKKTLRKGWKLGFGHGLPENVVCASNIVTLSNQPSTFKTSRFLKPQTCKTNPLKLTKNPTSQPKSKFTFKNRKIRSTFFMRKLVVRLFNHTSKKKKKVLPVQ